MRLRYGKLPHDGSYIHSPNQDSKKGNICRLLVTSAHWEVCDLGNQQAWPVPIRILEKARGMMTIIFMARLFLHIIQTRDAEDLETVLDAAMRAKPAA